jgi:hypothetical protein
MSKLVSSRMFDGSPSRLQTSPVAVITSLAAAAGGPGIFWPIVGIASVFIIAFVLSKVVRGDPYYERNAGRERRDVGGAPMPFGGDSGGDDGGGGSWF